jgi:acyl-CoA reductase-like NAD-dependent aldehyde dehydrogenase
MGTFIETEIGRYPNTSADTIHELVERSQIAQRNWQAVGFKGREALLRRWAKYLATHIDQLALVISKETGKPLSDALLEASFGIELLSWAAKNSHKYLKSSHRIPTLLTANMSMRVEHSPLGVVGVIGPWNYPMYTPMGSIAFALAAGNSVLFKPSEFTPGVGFWLGESFNKIAPNSNIFLVATGGPETGRALTASAINKLAFTGSTETGKKVAAACALNLTPLLMECGGKDAALIDSDANIEKAADAILWGAMSNAGQTCVAIERVYVHEEIAESFLSAVTRRVAQLRAGENYGRATMPAQLSIIDSHIKDASARGATFLAGGTESVTPPFVQPTIMINVPEDSLAMTVETFGPTLAVNRVADMAEAITLANASRYGLGASVWSQRNGMAIAAQLHCGMVSVNSVMAFTASPMLPFGGVKASGYGRIHGPEGLREFTYCRSVISTKFAIPLNVSTFHRTPKIDAVIKKLIQLRHR